MRHSMILALLGAGVWSCSSPWPWDAQPSQLQVRYAPVRAYGDPSIRPVVVVDDGSGERVITAEELRTAPQAVATEELGRAMLAATRDGYPSRVLEMKDIRRASGRGSSPN